MHHSPLLRAGLLLPALWLSACSTDDSAQNARGQDQARGGRVFPVAAAVVEGRDLARTVTVAGPVEPVRTIGVNSQMAGTVLSVRAMEGDRVAAGQLLAELDARETLAQLERARAVLVNAEAAYRRAEQLVETQIITDAEYEAARSAYEVARSEVALWETRLQFSEIRAPSPGVVTAKLVEAGSAVSPNDRLFDLADVSLLVVRVQLSELDVVHVKPSQPARVRLDAYPGLDLDARVRRVFPSADPQSRLVPVEVALAGATPGVDVRPGFLARVTFVLDRRERAIAIPTSAVTVAEQASFVYVIEGDTLVRRPVQLGVTAEGWVEVTSGLREGERVVVSGQASLRPGARVRITEEIGSAERAS